MNSIIWSPFTVMMMKQLSLESGYLTLAIKIAWGNKAGVASIQTKSSGLELNPKK
jgi:hypothetical protein